MNAQILSNLLLFLVVATLVWVVFRVFLFRTFVAELRHDLFALRRRLFLLMAQGEVSPTSPAYTRLRGAINALLEQADGLTPVALLMWSWVSSTFPVQETEFRAEVSQIPSVKTRREIRAIRKDARRALAWHCLRLTPTSPIMWPFVGAMFLAGFAYMMRRTVRLSRAVESNGPFSEPEPTKKLRVAA